MLRSLARLEGKVALITGAAKGLGEATAQEFIQHGARVIISDIETQEGPRVAKALGPLAHFIQSDVSIESQVAEAVNFATAQYGNLDIMYNNVGITGPAIPPSIADLNLDEFNHVMKVNVRAIVAGIKHAAPVIVPVGSGSILCTSSIGGLLGGLGPHPYSLSKFTIPGIVKSVGSELCRGGVRINCISPGPISTPMSVAEIAQFYPEVSKERVIEIINGLEELKGAKCEERDVARAVDGGFTCFKNLNFTSPDQLL